MTSAAGHAVWSLGTPERGLLHIEKGAGAGLQVTLYEKNCWNACESRLGFSYGLPVWAPGSAPKAPQWYPPYTLLLDVRVADIRGSSLWDYRKCPAEGGNFQTDLTKVQ